ncbi:MaoC family dehydratase [Halorubrum halodurans]|uniref:Molybdenum cofactor biosynthesis protein n=1 Tax=Halorubrum halodurans TaxID=1383851 RepID=A0A256ITI6_9EURY|nr:MaoC family dehydratase [Halorubrum halodurans]OYR59462.1 molybdenum cofactor biosynthesis protein [Halorubrum halodurans]
MTGRYYEEFEVGETIEHRRRRTVSEADNQRFCDMTMNGQPLHLDAAFAADTRFGERLVNGLYTMSLAVGISIPETTDGTIVANLSYDDVEHPNPVFHGDTIRAQSTVVDKRETSDGERGIVTMRVEAFTVGREGDGGGGDDGDGDDGGDDDSDDDVLVCSFERTALSLKRPEGDDGETGVDA